MKRDVKFIDRKTGLEVKHFSITVNPVFRRDFVNVGEGTIVEYDREYFDGEITGLYYNTSDGKDHTYKITKKDRNDLWYLMLLNERMKTDIRKDVFEESKTKGPFIITCASRIVTIGE